MFMFLRNMYIYIYSSILSSIYIFDAELYLREHFWRFHTVSILEENANIYMYVCIYKYGYVMYVCMYVCIHADPG